MKPDVGTDPFDVAGLNVQFTVSWSSPGSNVPLEFASWKSLIVAEVKATSVMFSVHCGLGQPGAPGIGVTGAPVVVVIVTFPFLMSPAGTAVAPVSVTAAGFWPGGCVAPAGLVQVAVGFPVADKVWSVSKFPRPA